MVKLIVASVIVIIAATATFAQQAACFPQEAVEQVLKNMGRVLSFTADLSSAKLHIYVDPITRGFSAIVYPGNGMGCIVSEGTNWIDAKAPNI